MEVEIRPEPGPNEREAILAWLAKLLVQDGTPVAYRSGWRAEGIRENADGSTDQDQQPV